MPPRRKASSPPPEQSRTRKRLEEEEPDDVSLPSSSDLEDGDESEVKPLPGTPSYNQQRRMKHKEIERRRRDAITKGIDILKTHLPNENQLETASRGEVVFRAAKFLVELKEESKKVIQQLALEKLVLEKTIEDLRRENTSLKEEMAQLKRK